MAARAIDLVRDMTSSVGLRTLFAWPRDRAAGRRAALVKIDWGACATADARPAYFRATATGRTDSHPGIASEPPSLIIGLAGLCCIAPLNRGIRWEPESMPDCPAIIGREMPLGISTAL